MFLPIRIPNFVPTKLLLLIGVPTALPIIKNPAIIALWSMEIGMGDNWSMRIGFVGDGHPSINPNGKHDKDAIKILVF